jgi:hypothetical protein
MKLGKLEVELRTPSSAGAKFPFARNSSEIGKCCATFEYWCSPRMRLVLQTTVLQTAI